MFENVKKNKICFWGSAYGLGVIMAHIANLCTISSQKEKNDLKRFKNEKYMRFVRAFTNI